MNSASGIATEDAPLNGLPEALPAGELLLWQGAPELGAVARYVLRLHWVVTYFLVLLLWRFGIALAQADSWLGVVAALFPLLLLGCAASGLLIGFAALSARTSLYSITTRRVVMRVGIALPVSFNIPFGSIETVAVKIHANGTGDISLRLTDDGRIGYAPLWPHSRPWKLRHPEPTLRGLRNAEEVAQILLRAIESGARRPDSADRPT